MPKHAQDDPYARVFDVEDDDCGDRYADEELVERDEFGYEAFGYEAFGYEAFGCLFPSQCCMPGPHFPSDCVSVEMMEDLFAEAELEAGAAGELDAVDLPMPDSEEGPF